MRKSQRKRGTSRTPARSSRRGRAARRGRARPNSKGASRAPSAQWRDGLIERLSIAADGGTSEEIGRRTGANHETVRRYMQHGRVPAKFLCAFCLSYKVEPKWLLMGKGPQRAR